MYANACFGALLMLLQLPEVYTAAARVELDRLVWNMEEQRACVLVALTVLTLYNRW